MELLGLLILLIIIGLLSNFMIKDLKNKYIKKYQYDSEFEKIGKLGEHFKKTKIPTIKLTINNKRYTFILDSGASTNILDKSFAEELKLYTTQNNIEVLGTGGVENSSKETNLEFLYNNQKFKEPFTIVNLGTPREYLLNIGIDVKGLLSADFFEKYKWMLDFNNIVIWKSLKN